MSYPIKFYIYQGNEKQQSVYTQLTAVHMRVYTVYIIYEQ